MKVEAPDAKQPRFSELSWIVTSNFEIHALSLDIIACGALLLHMNPSTGLTATRKRVKIMRCPSQSFVAVHGALYSECNSTSTLYRTGVLGVSQEFRFGRANQRIRNLQDQYFLFWGSKLAEGTSPLRLME